MFPEIAKRLLEIEKILKLKTTKTTNMTNYTTSEAISILDRVLISLKTMQASVKDAVARLEPLKATNEHLVSVVAELKKADMEVDAKLAEVAKAITPGVSESEEGGTPIS